MKIARCVSASVTICDGCSAPVQEGDEIGHVDSYLCCESCCDTIEYGNKQESSEAVPCLYI